MSPTPETLSLPVVTKDSQSEIVILDARGRLVQRGFGPEHTFSLEPGIYRVKVLTGSEFQERSVVLTAALPAPMRFDALAFPSPTPLAGTSTSHEYHMYAADRESRVTHVADGLGSSLFFLVRDWTPIASAARSRVTGNPAEGLSLYAVGPAGLERKVCDLVAGASNTAGDPWAACTIAVAPGVYELRLELPDGETLHQSVVASDGWQTQSFVFMRAYPGAAGPQWRADLSRTSVLMSRSVTGGFSPNEAMLRIAELARQSLATKGSGDPAGAGRPLMPAELRALLRDKWDNPFLGIYGGHLLLLEAPMDVALLREVVGNLRLLVDRHPDVDALSLRVPGAPAPLPFEHPPMLRRSWSLVVDASVAQPALVTDALARRNSGNFSSTGLWQIWRSSAIADEAAADPNALALSDVEAALAEDLGVMKHVRQMQARPTPPPGDGRVDREPPKRWALPEALGNPLLLADAAPAAEPEDRAEPFIRERRIDRPAPVQGSIEVEVDDTRLRSIAMRFGMPAAQVRRVLQTLQGKLTQNAAAPNLTVRLK